MVQLPAYAPDLNPTEGVRIQYRPDLLAGFLAQTGLTLDPEPP